MAPVNLQPTIQLTPWQKYQQALATYQTQNPQIAAQYETYGFAPQAPTQADPMAQGTKIAGMIAAKQAGSALAGGLGSAGTATTAGQLAGTSANLAAQSGLGAGLKGSAAAAQSLPAAGGIGLLPGLGIAAGVGLGGKAAYDMFKGNKPNLPGRIVLGMATGGLSEGYNALFNRKTTKDYQNERWSGLAEMLGARNPTAEYIANYQEHIKNPGHDKNPPKRFEDMQGLDLTPGAAFFDTFGRDWLEKYNEDQRIQIAQKAKDSGLIYSSKGDILTNDADKLREIAPGVLAQILSTPAKPVNNPNSPGFKDGKRINYGAKK